MLLMKVYVHLCISLFICRKYKRETCFHVLKIIATVPQRPGYGTISNRRCQKSYDKKYNTFEGAINRCKSEGCSYIQNRDCTRNDGFTVCTPASTLAEVLDPVQCVYQKGKRLQEKVIYIIKGYYQIILLL